MAQEWPKVAEGSGYKSQDGSCDCAQDDGRGTHGDGEATQNHRLTRENKRTPTSRSPVRVQQRCNLRYVAPTGIDPVTFRFSVERSTN